MQIVESKKVQSILYGGMVAWVNYVGLLDGLVVSLL